MWGQVFSTVILSSDKGIIPTRVGTSALTLFSFFGVEDHPHACGDKCGYLIPINSAEGSSPRVWGQASFGNKIFYAFRIIPTRVGTSVTSFLRLITLRDHPHACGDKLRIKSRLRQIVGSSPRVWGQASHKTPTSHRERIIPTRVGTSRQVLSVLHPLWDHPHACGDKKQCHTMLPCRKGSSPRVWGQDQEYINGVYNDRIIPTRVGTRLYKA